LEFSKFAHQPPKRIRAQRLVPPPGWFPHKEFKIGAVATFGLPVVPPLVKAFYPLLVCLGSTINVKPNAQRSRFSSLLKRGGQKQSNKRHKYLMLTFHEQFCSKHLFSARPPDCFVFRANPADSRCDTRVPAFIGHRPVKNARPRPFAFAGPASALPDFGEKTLFAVVAFHSCVRRMRALGAVNKKTERGPKPQADLPKKPSALFHYLDHHQIFFLCCIGSLASRRPEALNSEPT